MGPVCSIRNALVRANYEDTRRGVEKEIMHLAEFFKVLLFDEDIELKNRFLRIGQEYGTQAADAVTDLHRSIGVDDVGINETEERAMVLLKGDPRLTAASLATALGVEKRHAERILAALKKKTGLKRRGSRKSGEWYFE